MEITFIGTVIKSVGLSVIGYAIIKLANVIREMSQVTDEEPNIRDIIKKPRVRR